METGLQSWLCRRVSLVCLPLANVLYCASECLGFRVVVSCALAFSEFSEDAFHEPRTRGQIPSAHDCPDY